MIVDRIDHAADYAALLPHLSDAIQTIQSTPDMDGSRHFFEGGYVMCQRGQTKPLQNASFEAHRRYIDVFILMEGREIVLWNRLDHMQETAAYDPEKDKQPLEGKGSMLELLPGMFCVLFPDDAHAPCCHVTEQNSYVKYVVKLKI